MSWQPPPPPMPPPPPPPQPPPPPPPPPSSKPSHHLPSSSHSRPPPLSHPPFSNQKQGGYYLNNSSPKSNNNNFNTRPSPSSYPHYNNDDSNNSRMAPAISMNRPPPPPPPPSFPQEQFQNMSIQPPRYPPPPPPQQPLRQPPPPRPQHQHQHQQPQHHYHHQQQQQREGLIESRHVPRPMDSFSSDVMIQNNKRIRMMSDIVPRNYAASERTLGCFNHMPLLCTPFATTTIGDGNDDIQQIVIYDNDETMVRCSTCDAYDNIYNHNQNCNNHTCCLCEGKLSYSKYQGQQQQHLTSNHYEYIFPPSTKQQQDNNTIQLLFGLVMENDLHCDEYRTSLLKFLENLFSTYNNETSSSNISFQVGIVYFSGNTMIIPYCQQRQQHRKPYNNDSHYYWQLVETTMSTNYDDITTPLPLDMFLYDDISILKHILQNNDWQLSSSSNHFVTNKNMNDIYLTHLVHAATAASKASMATDNDGTSNQKDYSTNRDNNDNNKMTHVCLLTQNYGAYSSSYNNKNNVQKKLEEKKQQRLASLAVSHQVCVHMLYHNLHNKNDNYPSKQSTLIQTLIQSTNGLYLQVSSSHEEIIPHLLHLINSYHSAGINGGSCNVIFKVRCSSGIKIRHDNDVVYHNPGMLTSDILTFTDSSNEDDYLDDLDWIDSWKYEDEWQLPCMTNHTCMILNLKHRVGGIKTKYAYFQMATYYTHSKTQTKRLRVTTTQFVVSDDVSKIFRSANIQSLATSWTRSIANYGSNENEHQKEQYQRGVNILSNYRQYTSAKNAPLGQLILPECLQLLPLIMYSWNKKQNSEKKNILQNKYYDAIGHHCHMLIPSFVMLYLYPSLHMISDLDQQQIQQQHTLQFTIVPTTIQSIPQYTAATVYTKAFVLDTGVALYLYNPSNWNLDQAPFWKHINKLRQNRPYWIPYYNLGDDLTQMLPFLVEDSSSNIQTNGVGYEYVASGGNSYVEYICKLHQTIRKVVGPTLGGRGKKS